MIYLTYNDSFSGIYKSQVIDVCNYLQKEFSIDIRIVAFVSVRQYFNQKKLIKDHYINATVLPMFPKVQNWELNKYVLILICKRYKPKAIAGRSVLATKLALIMRRHKLTEKVIYDGRGAIAAEWNEYNVVENQALKKQIYSMERDAVWESDFRIAVSHSLVSHWEEKYNYEKGKEVVIPCTLSFIYEHVNFSKEKVIAKRTQLTLEETDIVLCYSGSLAGWQSFERMEKFLDATLARDKKIKIVFLSSAHTVITGLKYKFPDQVIQKHVSPEQVPEYLLACDYGLLIREQTVTNKVASPVKFAEYLACGLQVIISENLGDYSNFVTDNNCGFITEQYTNVMQLQQSTKQERSRLNELALRNFSKRNVRNNFSKIGML